MSSKICPECGAHPLFQREPKKSLPIEIATAIMEADLDPKDLKRLAAAANQAAPETTPRELAERVPEASEVIVVVSRSGPDWIQLLATVVAIVLLFVQHSDSEQAHRDAERAHRDARRAQEDDKRERKEARVARRTGDLSESDLREIVERIEARRAEP